MRRRPAIIWAVVLAVIAGGIYYAENNIDNQHLPWRAIDAEAPVGLATRTQLLRLSISPSSTCQAIAIAAATMNSVPAEPQNTHETCGWTHARIMYGSDAGDLKGESTMQCPLSIGTYIWLREVDALAREYLSADIAKIHHAGTYSCRRQNGNNSGQWSEHAFANAWDITGFELDDGRVISVLKDWDGEPSKRAFLRAARDQACNIFRVTLSPDYNDAHKDHFHVDMGPSMACR